MSQTLFISDLHLSAERLNVRDGFIAFLANQASKAASLYILGDLFEVWVGDDVVAPEYVPVLDALLAFTKLGIPVYIQHGNRDFLLGKAFERITGCQIIPDPLVIDVYGTRTLLLHGDTLCTDDVDYQQFRLQVRDTNWQQKFLSLPPTERIATAARYRTESKKLSRYKSSAIMDVNQQAVEATFLQHRVSRMIHGHTHRPAVHNVQISGQAAQRFVLGDWHDEAIILNCTDNESCKLQALSIST